MPHFSREKVGKHHVEEGGNPINCLLTFQMNEIVILNPKKGAILGKHRAKNHNPDQIWLWLLSKELARPI